METSAWQVGPARPGGRRRRIMIYKLPCGTAYGATAYTASGDRHHISNNIDTLLQAAHRTTDYMYIDTGVENSSLYRAAT